MVRICTKRLFSLRTVPGVISGFMICPTDVPFTRHPIISAVSCLHLNVACAWGATSRVVGCSIKAVVCKRTFVPPTIFSFSYEWKPCQEINIIIILLGN